MPETVAILGASPDPLRYAHKALLALLRHGHQVIPVNPNYAVIDQHPCLARLTDISTPLDTVTVYLRPELLTPLLDDLVAARPRRVILNPGTESPQVVQRLQAEGIPVEQACTLVMLNLDQF